MFGLVKKCAPPINTNKNKSFVFISGSLLKRGDLKNEKF